MPVIASCLPGCGRSIRTICTPRVPNGPMSPRCGHSTRDSSRSISRRSCSGDGPRQLPTEEFRVTESTSTIPASESTPSGTGNGQTAGTGEERLWDDRLYEIVHGQRVEKPMGWYEAGIASILGYYLHHYARSNQLGRALVEILFVIDLAGQLERRPDVAFFSYDRWPKQRRLP